jgi:hypothetical protein
MMSRDDRRVARRHRAEAAFGHQAGAALDALALLDLAWHDCTNEESPPDEIIEDIWDVADGDLSAFISSAYLAVLDFRDLRMNALSKRKER